MDAGRLGASLLRIAALRGQIAVLSRGGERELALRLLREHAALDLDLGLTADSLRRAQQAAALAEAAGDPAASGEALLVLALAMVRAGDMEAARRAGDVAHARAGAVPGVAGRRLLACAELVRGVAERVAGRRAEARAALDRASELAADLARPDLSAAVLVQLGAVELAEGAIDAAATCFWFARDSFRIARRPASAARVALLPLVALAGVARWADVTRLAPAVASDAAAQGLVEVAARARGLEADARAAQGDSEAAAVARIAADLAWTLAEGPQRQELLSRARLRLARLSPEPQERLRHLEAAIDLAVTGEDVALVAELAEALLGELAEDRVPPGAIALIDPLSAALRRLGARELADVAEKARAELE
jgi:hypothetical protein